MDIYSKNVIGAIGKWQITSHNCTTTRGYFTWEFLVLKVLLVIHIIASNKMFKIHRYLKAYTLALRTIFKNSENTQLLVGLIKFAIAKYVR